MPMIEAVLGLRVESRNELVAVLLSGQPAAPRLVATRTISLIKPDLAVAFLIGVSQHHGCELLRTGLVVDGAAADLRRCLVDACATHRLRTTSQPLDDLWLLAAGYVGGTRSEVARRLELLGQPPGAYWGLPQWEASLAALAALDVAVAEREHGVLPGQAVSAGDDRS